ncbi:MAG: tRNA (adenine-N1)-methyltransferase [Syntrophobacteraceae bacterium]|nr:tRNA (adenine-N1)-methyltransferase [Syntrophobacteraceae bacterium]
MSKFELNDWVLLTSQKGKKWLVRVEEAPYFSHLGSISLGDVIGKEEGDWLLTTKGARIMLFKPSLEDYIFSMKRRTQIIYPKDLSAMIFYGDIYPGCEVIETGIGSGALTLALLRAMCGRGRLVSIEKRAEFAVDARENVRRFYGAPPENHQIVVGDMESVSLSWEADRIFVDLPEPWRAIGNLAGMLRMGGLLVSLSPNVGQIQLTHRQLQENGFGDIVHFELLRRDWKVDRLRARPFDRMVAHTGFITVAKRVSADRGDPIESGAGNGEEMEAAQEGENFDR